jgi:hypothetical protein
MCAPACARLRVSVNVHVRAMQERVKRQVAAFDPGRHLRAQHDPHNPKVEKRSMLEPAMTTTAKGLRLEADGGDGDGVGDGEPVSPDMAPCQ